jgi:hypothetical protein
VLFLYVSPLKVEIFGRIFENAYLPIISGLKEEQKSSYLLHFISALLQSLASQL